MPSETTTKETEKYLNFVDVFSVLKCVSVPSFSMILYNIINMPFRIQIVEILPK